MTAAPLVQQLRRDDLKTMTAWEIVDAHESGALDALLGRTDTNAGIAGLTDQENK